MKLRTLALVLASLAFAALAGCEPKPTPPKASALALLQAIA